MGLSPDAHIAFGWIMPEDTDDSLYKLTNESSILEIGFAGSMFDVDDTETIIYLDGSEVYTSWSAKTIDDLAHKTSGYMEDNECRMCEEAYELGIKLPSIPASWILWPYLV